MWRNTPWKTGILAMALASVLPVTAATGTAAAQTAPAVEVARAGPPVILLADPEDVGTFVPPSGVDGTAPAAPHALSVAAPVSFAPGFPQEAKAAVQSAVSMWSSLVTSSQQISVLASWKNLGAGTLAGAGPTFVFRDFANAPLPGVWYPGPLAEALSGQNLGESDFDVTIDINDRQDWYFDTDGQTPSGRYDLLSVVLHEFGHGLGFLGTMSGSGAGTWGLGSPAAADIYDRFLEDASGQRLVTYQSGSTALGSTLRSGAVYFDSPQTNRGESDRLRLYAPNPWSAGSSISHLDEDAYPAGSSNSLMTPYLNSSEAVHAAGPLALCVLEALGWTTPQNCVPSVPTVQSGHTWSTFGARVTSGGSGSKVTAYGTKLQPGRGYRLVSGLDAGADRPCAWDTVPINPVVVYPNSFGFMASVSGPINRTPGRWQICFREETTGATAYAGSAFTFTVR